MSVLDGDDILSVTKRDEQEMRLKLEGAPGFTKQNAVQPCLTLYV
jgi:hypothetical protein